MAKNKIFTVQLVLILALIAAVVILFWIVIAQGNSGKLRDDELRAEYEKQIAVRDKRIDRHLQLIQQSIKRDQRHKARFDSLVAADAGKTKQINSLDNKIKKLRYEIRTSLPDYRDSSVNSINDLLPKLGE